MAYGSDWDFIGGTAPVLSSGANAIDRIDYIAQGQAIFTQSLPLTTADVTFS